MVLNFNHKPGCYGFVKKVQKFEKLDFKHRKALLHLEFIQSCKKKSSFRSSYGLKYLIKGQNHLKHTLVAKGAVIITSHKPDEAILKFLGHFLNTTEKSLLSKD